MENGYKSLDVYKIAHDLAVRIHQMTLNLPSFERYEEGSQVHRSSKRVSASIVEGHALRKHKALYLSYLYRALGSADETQEHLELLHRSGSLSDRMQFTQLITQAQEVSRRLTRFIQGVERVHGLPARLDDEIVEPPAQEDPDQLAALELRRRNLVSGIRNQRAKESKHGN